MRVIAKSTLVAFGKRHPDAMRPLLVWFATMQKGAFASATDLAAAFPFVSVLSDGYVVFNISGNKYRLLAHVWYRGGMVFVKPVMKHAEYTKRSDNGTLIPER